MKMTLPLAPSQNQLLRMHWSKRKKKQKDFEWLIVQQVGNRTSALCGVRVEQGTVVTIEKWDLDKVQDGR